MRFIPDNFTPLAITYKKIRVKDAINPKELQKDQKGKFIRDERLIAYCFQCFDIGDWLFHGKIVWAERPIEHFSTATNFAKFKGNDDEGKIGRVRYLAGTVEGNYRRITLHENKIYAHEIAFAMANGRWKTEGMEIRHINGNSLDNRPWNLKEVSPQENIRLRDDGNTKEALEEVLDERDAHPSGKMDGIYSKIDMSHIKIADDDGHCPIWRLKGIDVELSKKIAEQVQWHDSIMQPIEVVKDDDGKYFIADGYSRYNAAIELGYDVIDAVEVQRFDGMSAFDTAQAVSAKNNAHYRAKANNGYDNAMILWKKSCDGLVDIEHEKYRKLADRYKMSQKSIGEMKAVWKWFKDNPRHEKSGNWNVDRKMDEFANAPAQIRAKMSEETMEAVGKQMKKISELNQIIKDDFLFAQLLAKEYDMDLVKFAHRILEIEKDHPNGLRNKVKRIEPSLGFEE